MKITTVLLIATLVQVSAASLAQQLTYRNKQASLEQIFQAIRKQTGYNVLVSSTKIQNTKPQDVNFRNTDLKEVLENVLRDQPLTYEIDDKTILIKQKEASFLDKVKAALQIPITVSGRVTDTTGVALSGATVKIIGQSHGTVTQNDGSFVINAQVGERLVVAFTGFQSDTIMVIRNLSYQNVVLRSIYNRLDEVVVSTGYETIPKERATGSFTLIDNKTINRTTSPDLLSRLKGVTNGLLFDNTTGNSTGISVRGRSTIFSNTQPLIVIDNFPFEGDLNTLNPNDVESVTVLKDAAAASIWGVRAGNGVIVITTKAGKLDQKSTVNFNANLTIGDKPNLSYQPQLSSSEFIDVEKYLFAQGAYIAALSNDYQVISPAIALLQKAQLDPSFAGHVNTQIDVLRELDVRDQQSQYLYRKSSQQQYHVAVNGGGKNETYYFAAGYDKNLPNDVTSSDSRLTLKGNNTYSFFNNKLKLNTDITFSKTKSTEINVGYYPLLPYDQIADQNGNSLAVLIQGGLRAQYTDTAGNGKLLDWKSRPLDELQKKNSTSTSNLTDYRINLGLTYKIIKPLVISANYQYYNANTNVEALSSQASFVVRNQVNTYSTINPSTGLVTRPFPYGDIYSPTFSSNQSNYGRTQINFDKSFGEKHIINAIAGYEIREDNYKSNAFTLYNFNPATATSTPIDLINLYPYYYSSSTSTLGGNSAQLNNMLDRYISYYGNASYIYDQRYILSGSYRKDESNLFGVKANQKGVPLWSTGFAWNIDKERFFNISWLSSLQLKTTYGYNGNVNKAVSAYLTAAPTFLTNLWRSPTNQIINPPNENLKWERIQNINAGLYFATKGYRLSGSVEYYNKNGKDLIASSPIATQTGVSLFTGNTADTHTNGIDIQLNSKNIDGNFKWLTLLILNYSKDKITDYKVAAGSNQALLTSSNLTPLVGYPINPIFAYKWAGLDGSGNPQGYINGVKSIDYTSIQNSSDRSQLVFFGSATPTIFGSLRNTFSYKMVELSFNLTYKFNYYFRANALNYSTLFAGNFHQPDYAQRWQKPGDELVTNVPGIIYPGDFNRDSFYQYSSAQVEKGDHIRLQDIQVNFTFTKQKSKWLPLQSLNVYFYSTNLGILWKANKKGIDPDYATATYPNPKTFAFGLRTNL